MNQPLAAAWLGICLSLISFSPVAAEEGPALKNAQPVRLILDTDLESDVDDAGTLALLHALADRQDVELLAMGVSVAHRWTAPCLDALNTWYGRPDIPIGVPANSTQDNGSKYAETIAREYPHDLTDPAEAPKAAELYRKVLAAQPDGSVVIVTVGFLTNIKDLLESKGDQSSPLDGVELVRRKVRAWVCMGCTLPEGKEWNIFRDAESSRRAIEMFPAPIVFSGYEIGNEVMTGAGLKDLPKDHPVRRCYELYNGLNDRQSWDQTAALYAVYGLDGRLNHLWDLETTGSVEILPDGSNRWHDEPDKDHRYLVRKADPRTVAELIEGYMKQRPAREK